MKELKPRIHENGIDYILVGEIGRAHVWNSSHS